MKAFPRKDAVEIDEKGRQLPQLGMDLRDYFAAKAMQLYIGNGQHHPDSTAEMAYKHADAMIKARKL